MKKDILIWWSAGATSAVATKIALKRFGSKRCRVIYFPIKSAHPDNKRFIEECEEWYKTKIEQIGSKYDDQFDVIEKTRYVNGAKGARCTKELKRSVREGIERRTAFTHQVFGFEDTKREKLRADRIPDSCSGVFPLIEQGLSKPNSLQILSDQKIELPEMYQLGYPNNNCLAGDTKIITDRGAVSIKSIVDKPTMIRTSEGFELSTVKDYGLQQCYEVDISRDGLLETVVASYNHRWYIRPRRYRDELVVVPTLALQTGFKIPTAYKGTQTEMDEEGVRHGIIFGDGTKMNGNTGVRLIGNKTSLARFFPDYTGLKGYISKQPLHFKAVPDMGSPQKYKAGFIAGLMATDGSFKGGITLSQVKHVPEIISIMESIGITIQSVKKIENDTNFKKERTIYIITLISASFPPALDIRGQRKNFRSKHRPDDGTIVAIRKAKNKRVYCPTTSTSDIALKYGIITGQCIGCVKGGMGYWNKIRVDFPDIFNRMLIMERKVGRSCLKEDNGSRLFLDELDPSRGRDVAPIIPDCGFFCGDTEEYI